MATLRLPLPTANWTIALLLGCALGCGSISEPGSVPKPGDKDPEGSDTESPSTPGPVASDPQAVLNQQQQAQLKQLTEALDASRQLSADAVLEKHRIAHSMLSYDPLESEYLDIIQGSALSLSEGEMAKLGENGFVISKSHTFPTFVGGYAAVYEQHLPVYISADAILEAVHSSYDEILMSIEYQALIPLLKDLLASMHQSLSSSDFSATTRADVDVYLSVARSLLEGSLVPPVAEGDASTVQELLEKALAADGLVTVDLFGVPRDEDMSQFVPRGHYEGDPQLENYFRAMMWLGRIDMRLVETLSDGSPVFRRAQFDATLQLRALMNESDVQNWNKIDQVLQAFVGESDCMVLPEVDQLIEDLGGSASARGASDEQALAAIKEGGYGLQQIASHLMVNAGNVKTLPLNRSFLLFGQRYVLDSHVFSQVVYDRIERRMMPNPLDAAFAALGNDAALPLLDSDLRNYSEYPGALEGVRVLADAHDQEFWDANLYNLWLGSLRALSPKAQADDQTSGQPEITGTEAWSRRILSTQLASWAELRHDTLLYAKQSYTGIPSCEYPDAYVDPYPEFFAKVARFAERGQELASTLAPDLDTAAVTVYFDNLQTSMKMLQGMAESQLTGAEFSSEQMAFINDAVRIEAQPAGCTTIDVPDGWLADLYFTRDKAIEFDPTIADVHTQPADEGGAIVGKVLHVATGTPRLMVVTANTCTGAHAYAGLSFAYHERITTDFKRLTDEEWALDLGTSSPQPDPTWVEPILAE